MSPRAQLVPDSRDGSLFHGLGLPYLVHVMVLKNPAAAIILVPEGRRDTGLSKKCDDMSTCLDTVPALDRRTYRIGKTISRCPCRRAIIMEYNGKQDCKARYAAAL